MPAQDHSTPVNEADRKARAAFRDYTLHHQNTLITRAWPVSGTSTRTLARIFAGKRDVPPGLARELAVKIRADETGPELGWADALDRWADECAARTTIAGF